MSLFSKLKQKMAETFDKSYKTEDPPEFVIRLEKISQNEKKIKVFLENVTNFIEQSTEQVKSSQNIIEAMFVIYEGTPYEPSIRQCIEEFQQADKEIQKMENIKNNLIKVSNIVLDKIKDLQEHQKQREDERVYYDHYRTKLEKMQRPGGEAHSQDMEEMQTYARNQSKFENQKQKFEQLTLQVNEKLDKTEQKVDRVVVDLTLKFSKSVQLNFYNKMNQAMYRLRNIETQMIEIADKERIIQEQRDELRQKAEEHKKMMGDRLDKPFKGELDKYELSPRTQLAQARVNSFQNVEKGYAAGPGAGSGYGYGNTNNY